MNTAVIDRNCVLCARVWTVEDVHNGLCASCRTLFDEKFLADQEFLSKKIPNRSLSGQEIRTLQENTGNWRTDKRKRGILINANQASCCRCSQSMERGRKRWLFNRVGLRTISFAQPFYSIICRRYQGGQSLNPIPLSVDSRRYICRQVL